MIQLTNRFCLHTVLIKAFAIAHKLVSKVVCYDVIYRLTVCLSCPSLSLISKAILASSGISSTGQVVCALMRLRHAITIGTRPNIKYVRPPQFPRQIQNASSKLASTVY